MSLKGFVRRTVKKTKRILSVPTKGDTLITEGHRYYKPIAKAVTKSKSGKINTKARKKALDKISDLGNKDVQTKKAAKKALGGVAVGATVYAGKKGYDKYQEGKTIKGKVKKAYKKVKDKMK